MGRLDEHRRWLRMSWKARLKKLLSHLMEWEKIVQQKVGGAAVDGYPEHGSRSKHCGTVVPSLPNVATLEYSSTC